ncbi:hypothetical protein FM036_30640 [Nostoc sp. HG1]|nr:hypothetical protein [Nostoc sp. HG1]
MRSKFWAIALSMALTMIVICPAIAQLPLPNLVPTSSEQMKSEQEVVATWIVLDGRRLFQVAETRSNLSKRVDDIQQRLKSLIKITFKATLPNFRYKSGKKIIYP